MMKNFITQSSNSREASILRLQAVLLSRITHHASGILGAFALASLAAFPLLHAAPSSTNAPVSSRNDLSSFKLITERNIFNTRRSARYVPSNRDPNFTRRINRGDSFALVGTMHYDKGPFAFFDGTRSDYRKVLKPDDTIAGFRVAEISPSSVKLASSTNEVELPVGMQLRREDENSDWVKSERPESAEPAGGFGASSHLSLQPPTQSPPTTNLDFQNAGPDGAPLPFDPNAVQAFFNGDQAPASASFAATNAPVPGTEGVTDPVLLRMMQRRAQERGD
jgi:hypothetical protein